MFKAIYKRKAQAQAAQAQAAGWQVLDLHTGQVLYTGTQRMCAAYVHAFKVCYMQPIAAHT